MGEYASPGAMQVAAIGLRVTAEQVTAAGGPIADIVRGLDAEGNFIATYRGDAVRLRIRAMKVESTLRDAAKLLDHAADAANAEDRADDRRRKAK